MVGWVNFSTRNVLEKKPSKSVVEQLVADATAAIQVVAAFVSKAPNIWPRLS